MGLQIVLSGIFFLQIPKDSTPELKAADKMLSKFKTWIKQKENWAKVVIPILLLAGLFVAGRMVDIHKYLQEAQDWAWRLGPWGPLVFGAIYVVAMLFLLPGTPFTVFAALLFGTLWGYVTMVMATTAAAVAGFFMARYFAKDFVEKRLSNQNSLETMKDWVEENLWLAIIFVRIMPVFPFALNNYALGLTKVSFGRFLLASEIVFLPMNAVLVLGASAIYTAMVRGQFSWGLTLGSVGAGIAVLLLGLYGKKTLMGDQNRESSKDSEPERL